MPYTTGQTQPRTEAGRLGGEERFEHMLPGACIHSAAGIAHGQPHVFGRIMSRVIPTPEISSDTVDDVSIVIVPLIFHRVGRVAGQMQQHLLDLDESPSTRGSDGLEVAA